MRNENHMRRRAEAPVTTRLTYLLIGGGIGATLALLFAPKSGHELRGDIADATRKSVDKTKETASQIGARAGDVYSAATDRAGDLLGVAKDAAARKGNHLSAAIEAGKQAYVEEKRRTELTGLERGGPTYYEVKKS